MVPEKVMQERNDLLPFEMDHLPEFALRKAEIELKETPKTMHQGLTKLTELLSTNSTTIGIDFVDDFLKQFLRQSKYNVNKAFSHLQNFIRLKRKYSNLFQSIPEEYFSTKASSKFATVLPYRSPDGCTIVVCEIGKWDPGELSFEDFKRLAISIFVQPLRDPMTQINGFKIIHDYKNTSLKHLRYCTPQVLHFQYHAAMDCIPGRYKEIHVVNESILFQAIWMIVRSFVSEKIRNRVFFHSKPEDLLNHFPSSVLPVQYGGELINYYQEDLVRKMHKEYGMCPLGGQPNYF